MFENSATRWFILISSLIKMMKMVMLTLQNYVIYKAGFYILK